MLAGAMHRIHEPLEELIRTIPFRFDSIAIEGGRQPIGFRRYRHVIHINAQFMGRKVVATGEADTAELARAKAFSEIVERLALISTATSQYVENSNGWAAHPTLAQAKQNAIFELVERDAILAQWYSATPFFVLSTKEIPLDLQSWVKEELRQSEFPKLQVLLTTKGLGPSVTCTFKNELGFGVCGHATRKTLREAIDSALAETCRAAHATLRRAYWGDTLKLKNRELGHVEPGAHSVYYAYHEPFPNWMVGEQLSWHEANDEWTTRMASLNNILSQFQFTTVLESPLFVGFVKNPQTFDLHWGTTSKSEVLNSLAVQRLGLSSINQETHVVS
jgi:YcaO cyclodehydratase, ATP-ad Mg2+-binding